jgi:hypothetical protein
LEGERSLSIKWVSSMLRMRTLSLSKGVFPQIVEKIHPID